LEGADEERAMKVLENLEQVASQNPDLLTSISSKLVKVITEIFCTRAIPLRIRNSSLYLCGSFTQGLAKKLKKSEFFDTCVPRLFELLIIEAPSMDSFEKVSSQGQGTEGQGIGNQFSLTVQSAQIHDNILETLAKICEVLNIKQTLAKIMPMIISSLNPSSDSVDPNGNKLDINGNVEISDFLRKSNWAGMEVLGSVLEGSKRYYHKDLPNLMNLVMPFLENNCPMILYSTLTTLGVLSEEYYPLVQKNFGPVVLRKLGSIMLDEQKHVKLRGRAIGCLVNFTRELLNNLSEDHEDEEARVEMKIPLKLNDEGFTMKEVEKIFEGQFESVAKGVVSLFTLAGNTSNFVLLENSLVAVSILSNIMRKEFIKCYDFFSNGLKSLLSTLSSNEGQLNTQQMNLQILLVDTFSFLLSGCKDDPQHSARVNQDFEMILNFIIQLSSNISPTDSRNKAVLSFWSVVIRAYPEKYQPNQEIILSTILRGMGLEVKITMEDTESFQAKGNGFQSVTLDLKAFGGKKILSMDHGSMELKLTAFEVCVALLKTLPNSLPNEYKGQILNLVKSSLGSITSTSIKMACFKLAKCLIKSCTASEQRVQLLEDLLPCMITEISKFQKLNKREEVFNFGRKLISILRSVTKHFFIQYSWQRTSTLLTNSGLSKFAQEINGNVNSLLKNDFARPKKFNNFDQLIQMMGLLMDYQNDLKKVVRKEFENETMDQDTMDEFEEALAEGNEILQLVMEIYGEVLKFDLSVTDQQNLFTLFEKSFLAINAEVQQRVASNTTNAITEYLNPDEMTYISCFYCDSVELLDISLVQTLLPKIDQVCQILFNSCVSIPDVLQNLAYMNNLLASRFYLPSSQGQAPTFSSNLLGRLQFISQLKDLLNSLCQENPDMYGCALENSVSTLIRFAFLYRSNLFPDASSFHSALVSPLSLLPLQDDPVEGVVVHLLMIGTLSTVPQTIHENTQQAIRNVLPRIIAQETSESIPDKEILNEAKVNDDTVCAIIRRTLLTLLSGQ
jgi:hypothetical protein